MVHLISNRRHPGLVMEHYDPTTSVHTFKIAYPRRQQDESLLSSPSTPSLSSSSRWVYITFVRRSTFLPLRTEIRRPSQPPCKRHLHLLPFIHLDLRLRASVLARIVPSVAWIVQYVLHLHRHQNPRSWRLALFDGQQAKSHSASHLWVLGTCLVD